MSRTSLVGKLAVILASCVLVLYDEGYGRTCGPAVENAADYPYLVALATWCGKSSHRLAELHLLCDEFLVDLYA